MDREGLRSARRRRPARDARGGHELVRFQATHQAGLRANRSGRRRGRGGWARDGTGAGGRGQRRPRGGGAKSRVTSLFRGFQTRAPGTRGSPATTAKAASHHVRRRASMSTARTTRTPEGALATEGSDAREGSEGESRRDNGTFSLPSGAEAVSWRCTARSPSRAATIQVRPR